MIERQEGAGLLDPAQKQDKINYGINLLRMVSMLMIVILHTTGIGGGINYCSNGVFDQNRYYAAYFLQVLVYVCVDLFGFISGYVGGEKKFKISRLLNIWIEVLFWTILMTVITAIVRPELVTKDIWLNAFFPVFRKEYWYVTAYVGMVVFTPILNEGLRHVSKKNLLVFCALALPFFTIIPIIRKSDLFQLGHGYSVLWLIVLYIAGATMKKFDVLKKMPWYVGVLVYLFFSIGSFHIFKNNGNDALISYTSPLTVIAASGLFLTFANMRIRTKGMKFIINLLSPCAFAVFVIHVHTIPWYNLMSGYVPRLGINKTDSTVLYILALIGCSFVIYLACSLADLIRVYLFKLCRVGKLTALADKLIEKLPVKEKNDENAL